MLPRGARVSRTVQLSRGLVAIVDDEDYERVTALGGWFAGVGLGGRMSARRNQRIRSGRGSGARTVIYLHRFILNAKPGQQIDHKNGDTLDNRRSNLRFCTSSQNCQNRRARSDNASGFKGVHLERRADGRAALYVVQVRGNGMHFRRRVKSAIDGARLYDEVALRFFGRFARLNFPLSAPAGRSVGASIAGVS